ncbi:MAG: MotA/TolQ/ExbB proton channel family protein [Bdellovibrionales bacterium]
MELIVKAFSEGGFWMYPILAVQVAAVIITVERVMALYVKRSVGNRDLVNIFEDDIKRGNLTKVLKKAEALPRDSALRKVIEAGTNAAINMGGREEIQAKMDEVLYHEQGRIETRIEFLSMFGNVATLLGLLGTIVGMIRSFAAISSADQATKAAMLAAGISEAMNATAYGLIVAIPTLVIYSILQSRVTRISDDLTKSALRLFNLLGFHYESVPVKKSVNK